MKITKALLEKLALEEVDNILEYTDKSVVRQIQNILAKNIHTADLAKKLTTKNIIDTGKLIYLSFPESLKAPHMKKHFDKSSPGSVWSIPESNVLNLIAQTIKNKPTFQGQEGPAFKMKWLNQQAKNDIGFDSLVKVDSSDSAVSREEDLERFGMVDRVKDWKTISKVVKDNNYQLVTQDGKPYTEQDLQNNQPGFIKQEIAVKKGDKMSNPTKTYNLVTAKVGEIQDEKGNKKPVLSLMTVFPGVNPVGPDGKDITNKKDLAAAGYALLKSSNTEQPSQAQPKPSLQESLAYKRMRKLAGILKENNDVNLVVDSIEDVYTDLEHDGYMVKAKMVGSLNGKPFTKDIQIYMYGSETINNDNFVEKFASALSDALNAGIDNEQCAPAVRQFFENDKNKLEVQKIMDITDQEADNVASSSQYR